MDVGCVMFRFESDPRIEPGRKQYDDERSRRSRYGHSYLCFAIEPEFWYVPCHIQQKIALCCVTGLFFQFFGVLLETSNTFV